MAEFYLEGITWKVFDFFQMIDPVSLSESLFGKTCNDTSGGSNKVN